MFTFLDGSKPNILIGVPTQVAAYMILDHIHEGSTYQTSIIGLLSIEVIRAFRVQSSHLRLNHSFICIIFNVL